MLPTGNSRRVALKAIVLPLVLSLVLFMNTLAAEPPPLTLNGQLTQGGLIRAQTAAAAKVYLDDRALQVSASGDFIFGFTADAPEQVKLILEMPDGQRTEKILEIAQRTYEVQRIDGLDPKKVRPPPEVHERIAREVTMISRVRTISSDNLDAFDEFIWPLKGTITGVYGSRRILNGQPRSPHYGVDIAAPEGTAVKAPAGGTVSLIEDMYFSGITMVIDHGYGLSSTLLHLSKAHAAVDERVEQGQVIAEVGATGRVTGPHLDWRINWFGSRLDPQSVVPPAAP